MSTVINGTKINMTRGDTPTIQVQAIINSTGQQFTPGAGDNIYFRLKKTPYQDTVLLEKTVSSGQLAFDVNDTKSLDFGKYYYCLELVTSDGYHETFVEPTDTEGVFIIGKELENHGS